MGGKVWGRKDNWQYDKGQEITVSDRIERIWIWREFVDFGRWSWCIWPHHRFPWGPPNSTETHKHANVWTYGLSTTTTHTTMVRSYASECCA
jgi:hypothetical protein